MDDVHNDDVYEQWDEVVPEDGDVNDHIGDDVQVVTDLASGGVTTKWDQPLQVRPTVVTGGGSKSVPYRHW